MHEHWNSKSYYLIFIVHSIYFNLEINHEFLFRNKPLFADGTRLEQNNTKSPQVTQIKLNKTSYCQISIEKLTSSSPQSGRCSATIHILSSRSTLTENTAIRPLYINFIGSTASTVAIISSILCFRPVTVMSPSRDPHTNTRPDNNTQY